MIDLTAVPLFLLLPGFFIGGLTVGYGYFRALHETVNLIVRAGQPLLGMALTLGRLSLLATGFFIAVLAGGLPLLAALAGLLCAKIVMMRRIRREEM